MATVTNWIDHLSADEVVGAVYPGAGSSETLLVILGLVFWIGWHVLTNKSESEKPVSYTHLTLPTIYSV